MNSNITDEVDVWKTIKSWDQYENSRLSRLKDQKQRMKIMRDVLIKYSQIIINLQARNKNLNSQNESLRQRLTSLSFQMFEGDDLSRKYKQICIQLQKQRKIRENYQITVENLRRQLIQSDFTRNLQIKKPDQMTEIIQDYNILQGLYNELKDQIYILQKENLYLKQVIRNQSKLCYQNQMFWKTNKAQNYQDKQNKQKSNSKIKSSHEFKSTKKKTPSKLQESAIKIKQLQVEVKKQGQIIQKLKQAEDLQLSLIDKLKSQKSKICICHSHGGSSKKVVSSSGIVSFKKDSIIQQ